MSRLIQTPDFPSRQSQFIHEIALSGLDAYILNSGPSLIYFTGLHFHLSERPVVTFFTPNKIPCIVLPELECGKLSEVGYPFEIYPYSEDFNSWEIAFKKAFTHANLSDNSRIGYEPLHLRMLEYSFLTNILPRGLWVNGEKIIETIRSRKDINEVSTIRKAVEVAEQALRELLPFIIVGRSEKEIAAELIIQLLKAGNDSELPFAPIVASGPNSANPHSVPGDRRIQQGDLLLIDWSAKVDGYVSDLTRTFSMGKPDKQWIQIYQIIAQANAAGCIAGAPGKQCHVVDDASRQVINTAGYGDYFIHRTGHGIGMEVHEIPYLRAKNDSLLQTGMVYTVEPGIYLPGRGGIRIEDNVVITSTGSEILSSFERNLSVLG